MDRLGSAISRNGIFIWWIFVRPPSAINNTVVPNFQTEYIAK
jgi:hypothetical protein